MNKESEFKVIYSLRLMQYLVEHGLQFIEIIQHPFLTGFKAWVFEDTQELRDLMKKYSKNKGE